MSTRITFYFENTVNKKLVDLPSNTASANCVVFLVVCGTAFSTSVEICASVVEAKRSAIVVRVFFIFFVLFLHRKPEMGY